MAGREPDVIALLPAFSIRSDIGSFFSTSAAAERVHPARATTTRRQPLPTIRLRCRFQATSDRPYSGVTPDPRRSPPQLITLPPITPTTIPSPAHSNVHSHHYRPS